MALILLADELSCSCIFPQDRPIQVEDIRQYLHSNKAVDVSERAYEWVISWIAIDKNRFDENQTGEVWGKVTGDYIYIIKEILVKHLRENGFEYNAVVRKWAENRHIVVNGEGKYTHVTRMLGSRPRCIKMRLQGVDELGVEVHEKPPEEFIQPEINF